MKPVLNVSTKLNGSILCVYAEPVSVEKPGKYTFRLRDATGIIEEVKNIEESSHRFELPKYGQYYVQVAFTAPEIFLFKSSKLILYCESFSKEYTAFVNSHENRDLGELPYFEPSYPHQDFCVFHGEDLKNWSSGIECFAKERALRGHDFLWNDSTVCRVFTKQPMQRVNDLVFAFSGITRTKERLIIGDRDIVQHQVDPREVRDEVGDFFLIYQEEGKVHFLHDYFGLSKVYYYQSGNSFIASNRYHLLLLALKAVRIYPKPSRERLIADLSSASAYARLNYSRKMLMEDTFVMTSDKNLVLSKSGVSFVDNQLHEELCNPEPYDEKNYQQQLQTGANEMLDNMRVALEYPGADYFKIDLSGGLDSRMVMALITNFPRYHKQIQINTADLPYAPKDLPIALELNSMFDYPYDTLASEVEPIYMYSSQQNNLSACLCIDQEVMPCDISAKFSDAVLYLPGFIGELIFRPTVYTLLKGSPEEDNLGMAEFVNGRFYYNVEAMSEKGMEYFASCFVEELEQMPGNTPMAKLQNHYLMYRESIHHGVYYPSSVGYTSIGHSPVSFCPIWTVLASKTIFHLNNVTGMIFRSNKLAYDLMRMLNPAVASIPYEKKLYNDELKALAETDSRYAHTLKIADECIERQKEKWNLAANAKIENTTYVPIDPEIKKDIEEKNARFSDDLKNDALYALKQIICYDETVGDIVGLDCFSRIFGNSEIPRNAFYVRFLYNKLLTIYHVLHIFDYL